MTDFDEIDNDVKKHDTTENIDNIIDLLCPKEDRDKVIVLNVEREEI